MPITAQKVGGDWAMRPPYCEGIPSEIFGLTLCSSGFFFLSRLYWVKLGAISFSRF